MIVSFDGKHSVPFGIIAAFAFAVSTPSLAQEQLSPRDSAARTDGGEEAETDIPERVREDNEKVKPKKVCSLEKVVGSNLPRRICRTVSENEKEIQGMRDLDRMRQMREAQQYSQNTRGS